MHRAPVLVAAGIALLAGCASSDAITLEAASEGAGEESRFVSCEGAGAAATRLVLSARAQAGLATLLVHDGGGAEVLERHVATTSGEVREDRTLQGASGRWSVEERRTSEWRGELSATLECVV